MSNKAIFLDRDGVINEDKGYVYKKEDFIFASDVFEALRDFASKGYLLIIVTNQSGIERGYYGEADFLALNDYMLKEFEAQNVKIAKVYYCPHTPNAKCQCRKPNPKMLFEAQKEFDIDFKQSWLIGDKESDIEAGLNAGVKNLILLGQSKTKAQYKVKSLCDTIKIIF